MKLKGKVAIITGSTSGIGRASAELFAEEGTSVVISGRRRELGQQIVEDIQGKGGIASYFRADVTKSKEIRELISLTIDKYEHLDILMNNAYSGKSASGTAIVEGICRWIHSYCH